MTCKNIEEFGKKYYNLINFNTNLIKYIDNILFDLNLIRKGWKIRFVIDFHDILFYAYPYSEYLKNIKREGAKNLKNVDINEENKNKILKNFASLSYLFYAEVFYGDNNIHAEKPLLISPYLIELQNRIKQEREQQFDTILTQQVIKKLGREILDKNERILLKNVKEFYESNESDKLLDSKLHTKVVNLCSKKFPDILFLIAGFTYDGLEVLENMLCEDKCSIVLDSKLTQNNNEYIKDIMKAPKSEWFTIFQKFRKNKYAQNFIDSKAIDIVLGLNKMFLSEKSNEMIYLISSAYMTKQILNLTDKNPNSKINIKNIPSSSVIIDSDYGKKISILKDPYNFLLFMYHKENTLDETIDSLEESLKDLLRFQMIEPMIVEVSNKCIGNYQNCTIRDMCNSVDKKIKEYRRKYEELEITKIASNRQPIIHPFVKEYNYKIMDSQFKRLIDSINTLVKFLNGEIPDLDEIIEKQENRIELEIDKIESILKDKFMAESKDCIVETSSLITYHLKKLGGFPFRINLYNKKVISSLDDLKNVLQEENRDISNIRKKFSDLMSLTNDKEVGDEQDLLLATILYSYKKFDYTIKLLEYVLTDNQLSNKKEYEALLCLVLHQIAVDHRSKQKYYTSRNICLQNLENDNKDPRFYYLKGVIIGRGIIGKLENQFTLDDAIEAFDECIKFIEDDYSDNFLKAKALNGIAFSILLKDEYPDKHEISIDDLEYAKDIMLINIGEKIFNIEKWDSDFMHTIGKIYLLIAEKNKKKSIQEKNLIETKKYFIFSKQKAIEHKLLTYEKNIINKDIIRHNEFVKKIFPDKKSLLITNDDF